MVHFGVIYIIANACPVDSTLTIRYMPTARYKSFQSTHMAQHLVKHMLKVEFI